MHPADGMGHDGGLLLLKILFLWIKVDLILVNSSWEILTSAGDECIIK